MEREERYYVIKKSDLEAALKVKRITQTDIEDLKELLARLNTQRFVSNKEMLKCVVVESDWPEYEKVWRMIEDRVDGFGARPSIEELSRKAAMFDKIRDLMGYVQNGTDTSVTLFQDDATQWFSVAIGRSHERKGESAPSLEAAIIKMHHKYGGD